MFTGIVEGIGKIYDIQKRSLGAKVSLLPPFHAKEVKIGDSLSVDGVCLTVTEIDDKIIKMDIGNETLNRTTLSKLKKGDLVNVERALLLTDRIGGHIVAGHIDGIGVITKIVKRGDSFEFNFQVNDEISRYIVEKGSVAVNGVSLTVAKIIGNQFMVSIIPYTINSTTFKEKKVGDKVNIENDIVGKYIEKFLVNQKGSRIIDEEMLKRFGFK